jgi:hypothetical protein
MMDVMEEKPSVLITSCKPMKSLMKPVLFTEQEDTIMESFVQTLLYAEIAILMILASYLILIMFMEWTNLVLLRVKII